MEQSNVFTGCQLLPQNIELRTHPYDFSDIDDILFYVYAVDDGLATGLGQCSDEDVD